MTEVTVAELTPGDRVEVMPGSGGVFIAQTEHPIWPALRLVIWKLDTGVWSLDALSSSQVVGSIVPGDREAALKSALLGVRS